MIRKIPQPKALQESPERLLESLLITILVLLMSYLIIPIEASNPHS